MTVFVGLAMLWLPLPAQGLTLDFPGPEMATATRQEDLTSYRLPVGAWTVSGVPSKVTEGAFAQTAWRIDAPGLSTLQLLEPLRDQIAGAGYHVLFQCETDACGGFDFRYGTDVLPEPDMHIDLGDFRYLAAERPGPDGIETISLLVSRSATAGFVQLTSIGAPPAPPQIIASTKSPEVPPRPEPGVRPEFVALLEAGGAQPLDDLVFASGSADLAAGDYASLTALAAYLKANPRRNVALVGHTDASGALAGNIVLSRERAKSVRSRLIGMLGVPAAQVAAEGVGYLAPRDSNLTEVGRTRNRRVEVMLISTE